MIQTDDYFKNRYRDDPLFHSLVDSMVVSILGNKLNYSDITDAAYLASKIAENNFRYRIN